MDPAVVLGFVERVGLPIAILGGSVFLLWRLGARMLTRLIESYGARIAALEADRDHCRARLEAREDEAQALCASMVADLRGKGEPDE